MVLLHFAGPHRVLHIPYINRTDHGKQDLMMKASDISKCLSEASA